MPAVDWSAWTCRVRVAVTDRAALDEARAVVAANLDAVDRAASRFRVASAKVVCDGPGDQRALHVEAATA